MNWNSTSQRWRTRNQPLTPRQQQFIEHYAACGNATEAARRANHKKPAEQGYENLRKPHIVEALAQLTGAGQEARIATAEDRQAWWTHILRDPAIPLKDRLRASELLARSQGDFIERRQVTHGIGDWLRALDDKELKSRDEALQSGQTN